MVLFRHQGQDWPWLAMSWDIFFGSSHCLVTGLRKATFLKGATYRTYQPGFSATIRGMILQMFVRVPSTFYRRRAQRPFLDTCNYNYFPTYTTYYIYIYVLLYYVILYYIILYYILFYYVILYYIIFYVIILYYIIFYCIILYCMWSHVVCSYPHPQWYGSPGSTPGPSI